MGEARALRAWLTAFAGCVRRQDTERAKRSFSSRAYCFGSRAKACDGLKSLIRNQWSRIWPHITGFRFHLRGLRYAASRDGRWLCAMVRWSSTGYRAGRAFPRRGRMTLLLTRSSRRHPWRALHTHYSLDPGTPQTTRRLRAVRR